MSQQKLNQDISEVLRIDSTRLPWKRWSRSLIWAFLVLVIIGGVIFRQSGNVTNDSQFQTQEVRQGSLVVTVSATGNLEPTNQVDVGSELSGIVDSVLVDYNDVVKANQVLAKLDTDSLQAQVLQSEAALAAAEAKVDESQATVFEAELKLQRCQQLATRELCAQEEVDTDSAAYKRAQAAEASTRAQVAEARAKLDADRTNLAKSAIRSPINGVVLVRAVEPGQTVAASLQAPVLFTLAEDLSEMELHVDVDEADVGLVQMGQTASFTVDAFPDQLFEAQITQVRYGAEEVDGVVTYETVLKVDNSDLHLRPGMTATAEITVKRIEEALLIPNVALRFTPSSQEEKKPRSGGSLVSQLLPRRPPAAEKPRNKAAGDKKQQQVWVLRDGQLAAIPVTTGSTDGILTEVTGGDIEPGMAVIVNTVSTAR